MVRYKAGPLPERPTPERLVLSVWSDAREGVRFLAVPGGEAAEALIARAAAQHAGFREMLYNALGKAEVMAGARRQPPIDRVRARRGDTTSTLTR